MRTRITPAVFYYYKAFGAFGEYVRSTQAVDARRSATRRSPTRPGKCPASFLLTGEAASSGITRPRNALRSADGKWGALQIVARYSRSSRSTTS